MRVTLWFVVGLLPLAACTSPPAKPSTPKPVASKAAAGKKAVPTAANGARGQQPVALPVSTASLSEGDYVYETSGRRDPFLSLVEKPTGAAPRVDARKPLKRGDGLGGILVDEVIVRGVGKSEDKNVALIQGGDRHTYLVHPGDKLMDGTVKSINPQGLVIVQDVTDPLAKVKHREVRKLLRPLEDVKQ